ncbi:MAG: hypothetical protein ACM3KL_01525 [Alphaproteobacteria bacterium]
MANPSYQLKTLDAICIAVLVVYFLHFALPARHGGFRDDEMMNLWTYWYVGELQSLMALAKFWTPYYRPGGALYYLPLYHFFGLNPFPYRIVQISILTLTIPVAYYLVRLLASSRSVAFLAILTFCYHPAVANLVFVGAFIYDVLCGFFYLAALTYYVQLREQGIRLRPAQLSIFLLLYVLALDCKEMAVTLPIIILLYEFLKATRWSDCRAFLQWSLRYATPSLMAGAVTAIYLYGKVYGTGSLTKLDPYRPRYSWHQFLESNAKFLGELFFAGNAITPRTFWVFWAVLFIYAAVRRDRTIRLMAFWVVIVPLPLVFLLPIRGGACLYLLLFGWATIFAKVACDLVAVLSIAVTPVGQRTRVASRIRAGIEGANPSAVRHADDRIGDSSRKISISGVRITILALLALCLATFVEWENRRVGNVSALLGIGQKVSHVIAAFDSLNLQPAPNSTVLLKVDDQLFHNKWHALFIASLVWNDHSIQIWIENLSKITAAQRAKADYIILLTQSEATLIRSPNVHPGE